MAQRKYGLILSPIDHRDHHILSYIKTLDVIPEEWQLQDPPRPPTLDQDGISACLAHVLTSQCEWHNWKDTGTHRRMAPGYSYARRDDGTYMGEGMDYRDGYKCLQKRGIPPFEVFPWLGEMPGFRESYMNQLLAADEAAFPQRILRYARVYSPAEAKSALIQLGPVGLAIAVYPCFEAGGKLIPAPKPTDQIKGYHAIMLIGWTREGWLIQNSWGEDWGDRGTAVLSYAYPIQEMWAVTDFEATEPEPAREIIMGIDDRVMVVDGQAVELDSAPFVLRDLADRVIKAHEAGMLHYVDDPDGQILDLGDWQYRADRTYPPLRKPLEAIGYSVVVDLESRKIFIRR
ncbi:MAG TPA: C1 family peptidase [Bacillota bacterium]